MPIRLPAHVHLAEVDGDLVFLDARRNQYACVARGAAGPARQALAGSDLPNRDDPVIAELGAAGLILADAQGPGWTPLARPAPHADYIQIGVPGLRTGIPTLAKLVASACAGWSGSALAAPERWLRHGGRAGAGQAVRAASLALQFDRLRPWLPCSGRCLPNSLMLRAFLRHHGIVAELVLGVRTFPFDAHCWLEAEGVVLNDVLEHVAWFTPIAAR